MGKHTHYHGFSAQRASAQPTTSKSNTDLVADSIGRLKSLRALVQERRSRDRACMLVADVFVDLSELSQRFGRHDHGFREGRVNMEEEEGLEKSRDEEGDEITYVPLSEILGEEAVQGEEAVADALAMSVRGVRRYHYRQFLDYLLHGSAEVHEIEEKLLALARSLDMNEVDEKAAAEMTKNILAEGRRVAPLSMIAFGNGKVPGQIDVSRKIKAGGECRATTQAREKRRVEEPLKASGAKGYKGLGGLKTQSHSERCRDAQKGNGNRRAGQDKRRKNA